MHTTPGVCKVNKIILTIFFSIFTTLLPIKVECLTSLWSALQRHRGPEEVKQGLGWLLVYESRFVRAPPKFFCLLHHEYPYSKAEETLGTTTNNYFSVTLSEDSSFGYNLHAWLFFLVLFPPLSFFWVLFISIYGKHIFASLLQTYTTHRIVDFIIAEKVQQCICPWGAIMTAHTEIWMQFKTFDYQWVFTSDGLCHSGVWETDDGSSSAKLSSGQWTKPTGSSLCNAYTVLEVCLPNTTCHSFWFWFPLSYFIMFCSFCVVLCLCVCVLICFFCVSTPPLSCFQLAPSVSTHPSDLIPCCMPSPYTLLHLTAWQSLTIALTFLYLTNTFVA